MMQIDRFLTELSDLLARLGGDGVNERLLAHAAGLRPGQRAAFLEVFRGATMSSDDRLLADVAQVIAQLEAFEPDEWVPRRRSRFHYDDEYDNGKDAELMGAVDDLLVALGERFIAGRLAVAADGYDRVLSALVAVAEESTISANADLLREARDRLLWHLSRSGQGEPAHRAAAMGELIERTATLVGTPTASELLVPHPTLGALETDVLREFAQLVWLQVCAGSAWQNRQLLNLALQLREHLDGWAGVLMLAHDDNPVRLGVYGWAVNELEDRQQLEQAADLAMEALADMGNSYEIAELADHASAILRSLDRTIEARAASMRAWLAAPSVRRLELLLDAAADEAGLVVSQVAARPPTNAHLAAIVAVLDRDLDTALTCAQVDRRAHTYGYTETARLLVAACCRVGAGSDVDALAHKMFVLAINDRHVHMDALVATRLGRTPSESPVNPMALRLLDAVAEMDADPARVADAQWVVEAYTAAVLESKERALYGAAAEMVVLLDRTSTAAIGTQRSAIVRNFEQRYNRFSAFRAELKRAAR